MRYALLILLFCGCRLLVAQSIGIDTKTGESGTAYTFIKKNNCVMSFETTRPDKNNAAVQLCIPAAFTNLSNDKIDGAYAVSGKTGNEKAVNTGLGGVLMIDKGHCRMFQSGKGKLLNDSLLGLVRKDGASFFQQIQCIQNGKASSFKDQKVFQRRGIAMMKDGSVCVVESKTAVTLAVFSQDLVKLGVQNLMYTDMGAWDEGWYRDPASHQVVVIGKDLSQTARQSNWVVFKNAMKDH